MKEASEGTDIIAGVCGCVRTLRVRDRNECPELDRDEEEKKYDRARAACEVVRILPFLCCVRTPGRVIKVRISDDAEKKTLNDEEEGDPFCTVFLRGSDRCRKLKRSVNPNCVRPLSRGHFMETALFNT